MERCDTYIKERRSAKGNTSKDLWCRTHDMWVYQSTDSELLNQKHEVVRWPEDSPSRP